MSSRPSLIYNNYRPGFDNPSKAEIFMDNRARLRQVMDDVSAETGVTFERGRIGGVKTGQTLGFATLTLAKRSNPPLTPEEASQIGDRVVDEWAAIALAEQVPEYCDTVLALNTILASA